MFSRLDDILLVEDFRSGDEDALIKLASRYRNLIKKEVGKIEKSCKTSDEIEDLYQIAYIVLAFAIEKYDIKRNINFGTFYKVFLRNTLCNHIRKNQAMMRKVNAEALSFDRNSQEIGISYLDLLCDKRIDFDPQRIINQKSYIEEVANMIKEFTALEQEIFLMRIRGHSYKEISTMYHINTKKIDNTIRKIKKQLRIILLKESN